MTHNIMFELQMMNRKTGFIIASIPAGFLPAGYVLLLLIHLPIAVLSGWDITPERSGSLWWIGTLAIWLTIIQWPFYFLWVAISPELSLRQKIAWGIAIFLGNMFAMPYFLWCKYRNSTISGLLSIIGRQKIREYLKT